MNLIIDIGNSLAKVAVFQTDELLLRKTVEKHLISQELQKTIQQYPGIKQVLISKVTSENFQLPEKLLKEATIHELSRATALPFINRYATPETLGNDRKGLVAAAVKQFPAKNVLVIDAGTCITYDFKNRNEEYLGGGISPGLKMRFLALNTFTANLPLVEGGTDFNLIGDSTVSSITSGVVNGTLMEIQGIIEGYRKNYDELETIITGGDASFLSINLKNGIFANSNFLLEGLNHILEFNIDQ